MNIDLAAVRLELETAGLDVGSDREVLQFALERECTRIRVQVQEAVRAGNGELRTALFETLAPLEAQLRSITVPDPKEDGSSDYYEDVEPDMTWIETAPREW
jgi:hypothetical protein